MNMYDRNPDLSFEADPAMQEWRDKGWVKDPLEFYKAVCNWSLHDMPPMTLTDNSALPGVHLHVVPEMPSYRVIVDTDIAKAS